MVVVPVDRGDLLQGQNDTVRDSRVPHNIPRSIRNFRLPDGKARRRPGFSVYNSKKIHGNMLSKHTASVIERERATISGTNPKIAKTPLSYGLIRWHDDFQPKVTRDWTVEFLWTMGDLENYVVNPFTRRSENTFGASPVIVDLRSTAGVYLFDQALLANHLTFTSGGQSNTTDPTVTSGSETVDTFGLSALSISHTNTLLEVTGTLINSGVYDNNLFKITHTLTSYSPTDTIHIAVTYATTSRQVTLYVDGSAVGLYVVPAGYVFVGEEDALAGGSTALQRDIVLLNEHTVRGHYSSACKSHVSATATGLGNQTYGHSYASTIDLGDPDPWACSPPRGTGMSELRIWHQERTTEEITANMLSPLGASPLPDELKGYWRLNDGGPISFDTTTSKRHGTIHHGNAAYISDIDLLGGIGLLLADGQHIKKEFGPTDFKFIEDSHIHLTDIFEHDPDNVAVPGTMSNKHDFTVQMQIRTPYTWQQELNKRSGAVTYGGTQSDTREMMETVEFALYDGGALNGDPTGEVSVRNETGSNILAANTEIWHRSYDTTLFAVEGQAISDLGGRVVTNLDERRRVPLCRGLLTPTGNVALEWFGLYPDSGDVHSREFRLVSTTALSLGTIHTITFSKRALFDINGSVTRAYGFELAIYIDDSETPDITLTVGTGLAGTPSTDLSNSDYTTFCMPHGGVRDVLIGASYVNDASDGSIDLPLSTGNAYLRNDDTRRFMSCYQDQPGFFTLGFWRMWSNALSNRDVARWSNNSVKDSSNPSLIFNLEIDSVTGPEIPSKSRFSSVFSLGFKSWGLAQQHLSFSRSAHPGAYSMEDRLGYSEQPEEFQNNTKEATCNGLSFFSATLGQSYGLLAVMDDVLFFDNNLTGNLRSLPLPHRGMLNEFATGQRWEGTVIGDRTILTSPGAVPKVYDGKVASTAGFREWQGGSPILSFEQTGGSLSALNASGLVWFSMRIVYTSENKALQHISPVQVIKIESTATDTDTNVLRVDKIPPHPDPRITSIYVCFSAVGVASRDLAIAGAVGPVAEGPLPNKYVDIFRYTGGEILAPIDTNVTPLPICAHSASLNGRLYLSGSIVEPDTVFFSDAGNPERFDVVANKFVLEEGSGDRVVGLIAIFGSLFSLKPNSIWRIDEVAVGVHQQQRVAKLGPVSRQAVELIVIPESGRVAMVMWTFHGPYIFDGINFQYIGFPIEGPIPYDWLDTSSVFITHDVIRRDLIFHFKSKKDDVITDRHDEAIVYNYRSRQWYEYGELIGSTALSLAFTQDISKSRVSSPTDSPLDLRSDSAYVALIGGENGHIYKWGEQDTDGLLDPAAPSKFQIISSGGSLIEVGPPDTGSGSVGDPIFAWANNELHRLWATIVRKNFSDFFSIPILSNGESTLILDTAYSSLKFIPAVGDTVFVGRPPAQIVFPWDLMGQPFIDKTVKHLTTWQKKEFYHRYARDWNEKTFQEWLPIRDSEGTRRKTAIHVGKCEAFKLETVSYDLGSELDAYAYHVEFKRDGTQKQRIQ